MENFGSDIKISVTKSYGFSKNRPVYELQVSKREILLNLLEFFLKFRTLLNCPQYKNEIIVPSDKMKDV